MKAYISSFCNWCSGKHMLPVLWFFASLLGTLLAGGVLFRSSTIGNLTSIIVEVGLDPLRAQLISALIMTMGTALIGAFLGRRKVGTLIGAGIVFWFNYLSSFIQLERLPTFDPGGHLQILNTVTLLHTSSKMMALALLSAFIGSAVGTTLGEVLLDPLYQLVRHMLHIFFGIPVPFTRSTKPHFLPVAPLTSIISKWLGAAIIIGLLILTLRSGDMFIFSPDVGLHNPPDLHNTAGILFHGTIVQDSVVSSALGGQHKSFQVYLPPSYNTPQGRQKHYPTLYLLHGSPGKDIDWIKGGKVSESADILIATHQIPELILILPDGNGRQGETSEWGNSFDQHQLIETYTVHDLVQYVDQHYRTIPDPAHRAIGGLSMGGFGAMNIAAHHPDIFGTVISLGGYYNAEGAIWGKSIPYRQENSPAYIVPRTKQDWKLHIYLGAATKDQPYYNDTRLFMLELGLLHIPYQFDLERGYHSWGVWQVQMYHALVWLKWK